MSTRSHTAQPQYNAPINYRGLGNGVKILFNPALGPIDLATGRQWTPNATPAIEAANSGRVFSFNAGGDRYGIVSSYSELSGNGTFFVSLPKVGTASTFGHIYFRIAGILSVQIDNSNRITLSGINIGDISGDWFNTVNRSLIYTLGPTQTRVYVDGRLVTTSATTMPSLSASSKDLQLGGHTSGVNWDTQGQMLSAGWVSSLWGDVEAKAFHENPHQLFKYPSKKRRSVISIGGVTYTITPSGIITLSGSTNLLKTKIFLPLGNISFGGTSTLTKTKIISPNGNITLSGSNPVIKTKIVDASGTISFTGTSPVIRSKIIEAEGGINFSGTASLSGAVSYILTPLGGVTFNGSSSLIKTHIQIPTGKISFSGNSPMESNTVIITVSTRLPLTGVGK